MQTQESRDEKTVAIATALGLFVLVVVVGSGLLWVVSSVADVSDQTTDALFMLLLAGAGLTVVANLVRVGTRKANPRPLGQAGRSSASRIRYE